MASKEWDLLYSVEIPIFAVCGWILSVGFVLLSCKITSSIEDERRTTIDYIEHSRRVSVTGSRREKQRQNRDRNNTPLIYEKNASMYGAGGQSGDHEQSISVNQYPPPIPPQQQQQDIQTQNTSDASHIIPRLVKLSLLIGICWFIRGLYVMALRIWPSTDTSPFDMPDLAWEAIFYCCTEYPPSLGALILMISKPKRRGLKHIKSAQQDYPDAKDYPPSH
eukprot:339770_1